MLKTLPVDEVCCIVIVVMKKIYTAVLSLVIMMSFGLAAVTASPAQALECSILPSDLCSEADKDPSDKNSDGKVDAKDSVVWDLLTLILNILTAGAAIAAVGGIVYGAVLYTSAGGSQEQVKKARGIFVNVAIGVVAFASMYALLQWLIPGGVF